MLQDCANCVLVNRTADTQFTKPNLVEKVIEMQIIGLIYFEDILLEGRLDSWGNCQCANPPLGLQLQNDANQLEA